MTAVLEVDNLRKKFGATTALRDVSLQLQENEVLARRHRLAPRRP
jgi:ABC-type multidrug transport system ATPase subunit